jgi:hypothetical protein
MVAGVAPEVCTTILSCPICACRASATFSIASSLTAMIYSWLRFSTALIDVMG